MAFRSRRSAFDSNLRARKVSLATLNITGELSPFLASSPPNNPVKGPQSIFQPVPSALPKGRPRQPAARSKSGRYHQLYLDPSTYRLSSDTHEKCAVAPRPPYRDIPREARQAPGKGACGNLIVDADSTGVTHKYIYGKGLLAVATSAGRYCYHFNGTGSTVAITDMNT